MPEEVRGTKKRNRCRSVMVRWWRVQSVGENAAVGECKGDAVSMQVVMVSKARRPGCNCFVMVDQMALRT